MRVEVIDLLGLEAGVVEQRPEHIGHGHFSPGEQIGRGGGTRGGGHDFTVDCGGPGLGVPSSSMTIAPAPSPSTIPLRFGRKDG